MAKRLWDYFNGEPFLVNPHLAVLGNPTKKGLKKMAVRRRKRVRRAVARVTRRKTSRRRYRRNPYPVAGLALNPRRRRRSRRNPVMRRRSRRHHYRRNPALLGISLPPLQSVVFVGIGFIAPPVVEGFLSQWLPASIQTSTLGKYAVKIGSVLGLSFIVKQVMGAEEAKMVAIGGGAYVLHSAINDFAPGILPAGMSGYVPGTRISSGATQGMSGYVRGTGPTMTGLGMNVASFPGSTGARGLIPTRYNRF